MSTITAEILNLDLLKQAGEDGEIGAVVLEGKFEVTPQGLPGPVRAYSFRECVSSFDDTRREWALKVITHFLEYGEDQFLVDAGKQVYKLYPELWDKGCAGSAAKREWSRKRDEEFDKKMSQQ